MECGRVCKKNTMTMACCKLYIYYYYSFQRKCEQYWAEGTGDAYKTHGNNILVTTLSETSFANFVIRTFTLRQVNFLSLYQGLCKSSLSQVTSNDKELKVTQYHFTSWPDYGVPKDSYFLLSFIKRIQRDHNKELGVPLLVHCSAGVGRTGTFITLDAMLEKIYSEDSVNVYEFVKEMRQRRVSMIQTPVSRFLDIMYKEAQGRDLRIFSIFAINVCDNDLRWEHCRQLYNYFKFLQTLFITIL